MSQKQQSSVLRKMADQLYKLAGFRPPVAAVTRTHEQERAVSMEQAYQLVYQHLYDMGVDYWYMHDIYVGDDGMYAIYSARGVLHRIDFEIVDGAIVAQNPVEVEIEHVPRSSFHVMRSADGKMRFVSVASVATINRVGEIDSTALYDSMIATWRETGDNPYLTFYHSGEQLRMGEVDWIGRNEYTLVTAGVFDDTPIGRAAYDTLTKQPDEWGVSIAYQPTSDPEMMRVGNVEIPVYTQGRMIELSILREAKAASWFTSIGGVERMAKRDFVEDLAAFVGNDLAQQIADTTDELNRSLTDSGAVTRADDSQADVEVETQVDVQIAELELNDAAIEAIAERVADALETRRAADAEHISALQNQVDALTRAIALLTENVERMAESDAARLNELAADMPARPLATVRTRTPIQGRPSQRANGLHEQLPDELKSLMRRAEESVPSGNHPLAGL